MYQTTPRRIVIDMNKLFASGAVLCAVGLVLSLGNLAAGETSQGHPLAYWAGAFWVAGFCVLLAAGGRWLYRRRSLEK
jgi:hypothetical protein